MKLLVVLMAAYDLHAHSSLSIGENTIDEMAEMAKNLGLNGLGIATYSPVNLPVIGGMDIVSCVIIEPSTAEDLEKEARKIRSKAEILMVHGGNYDVNRAACENSIVDVLCHPELDRRDSGLDHICVKAAQENNVAIEINFREILESYKKKRVNILSSIKRNVKLCNKYGARIVTTSGALTKWQLRSPRELAAFAKILGMDLGDAITTTTTVPEEMIRINREKLAGRAWEGVSVVDGQ